MRFVLYVEGETEYRCLPAFFKKWLDSQLSKPVGITVRRFEGAARLISEIQKVFHQEMRGKGAQEVIAGIGLLDLFGFPKLPANLQNSSERRVWAVKYVEDKVNHPKFRMYLAVHELEAWLLSDAMLFPAGVQSGLPKRQPEEVNFGRPPSKLLERLYRERLHSTYMKTVHGKNLFGRLDPGVAYRKCPYLQRMMDDMLTLARQAGL